MRDAAATPRSATPGRPRGVGERVRALRVAAGLTQTELAGERFSKEYVSQIERGKTRPTADTVAWLAERLGVDDQYLQHGVSADVRTRVEAKLAQAEALSEAHRDREAVEAFRAVRAETGALGSAELELRALAGEGWALQELGAAQEAIAVLQEARELTELPRVLRHRPRRRPLPARRAAATASRASRRRSALLDQALELAERSGMPCDVLRARILAWRSRCRRRQARLRGSPRGRRAVARARARRWTIRASSPAPTSRRRGSPRRPATGCLARQYALQAREIYAELNDARNTGRLMLNLGGLQLLLGHPEQAIEHLTTSFALAVESGSQPDAAQALGSLAAVHEHLGDHEAADEHARKALALLEGREDFLDEIGQSNLVLGRSLLERGRLDEAEECFRAADAAFEQMSSIAHRTGAWVALGDLAERRGDAGEAARCTGTLPKRFGSSALRKEDRDEQSAFDLRSRQPCAGRGVAWSVPSA